MFTLTAGSQKADVSLSGFINDGCNLADSVEVGCAHRWKSGE